MKNSIFKFALFALVLGTPEVLIAESEQPAAQNNQKDSRAMMKTAEGDDPQNIVSQASRAYRELQKGQPDGLPESLLKKTQCVVIVPDTVTAAVGIGGSHGDGIAACKNGGKWSQPAFVDLDTASLGAQVGAKSSDVVLFLTSEKAVNALKKGSMQFGADVSVVAGNFERSFDVSGAGAVAYQTVSGAYAGASLAGGKLTADQDSNEAYYNKKVEVSKLLSGQAPAGGKNADELISQLP